MTEDKYRFADVLIKTLSAVVATGVAAFGLLQYMETANQNRATQCVEQQKILIEKTKLTFELNRQKIDILGRAAQAAANATWTSDAKERLKAIDEYTKVFVGELSLVANQEVIATGDALNESLTNLGRVKPSQTASETIAALNTFVGACRKQAAAEFPRDTNPMKPEQPCRQAP